MKFQSKMAQSIPVRALLAPGTLLAAALLIGRLSGLAREALVASRYGLTEQGDLAVVIMTIPDLLVNLIISGGLSAALVPRLTKLDSAEADELWRSVLITTLTVFFVFALAVLVAPALVLAPLLPGRIERLSGLNLSVLVPIALSIPLAALTGLTGAYLNAHNRFLVAGLGTLLFNVGVVSTLFWCFDRQALSITPLAIGVLVGAILRVGPQISIMPRHLFGRRPFVSIPDNGFARQFFAGIAATTIMLLASVLIRSAASFYGPGTVAAFNYAQKLVELPLGMAFGALNTIALTKISRADSEGRTSDAREAAIAALRLSLALAGVFTIGGVAFSSEIVALLFGYGRMSGAEQESVATLFRIAVLSVPFSAASLVAMTYLNASGRTTDVFKTALIALVALPILVFGASLVDGSTGLMWAFVVFQLLLAGLMIRRSGLTKHGHEESAVSVIFDWRFLLVVTASWVPMLLATFASNHIDETRPMLRIALAALGGMGGVLVVLLGTKQWTRHETSV